MARLARAVAPGFPHHITQRGNRRQQTFFSDQDFKTYLVFMSEWCLKYKVEIWAYCLMPNHIHLIAVPETKDGLNLAIGEAHRRYTRMINFREGWRGHLWQGRFASFIMEERYLLACTRYIEYNPVRAGFAKHPEDWKWSSAGAHMDEKDDILVKTNPLLEIVNTPWRDFLSSDIHASEIELFRKHERPGRALGKTTFVKQLETIFQAVEAEKAWSKEK